MVTPSLPTVPGSHADTRSPEVATGRKAKLAAKSIVKPAAKPLSKPASKPVAKPVLPQKVHVSQPPPESAQPLTTAIVQRSPPVAPQVLKGTETPVKGAAAEPGMPPPLALDRGSVTGSSEASSARSTAPVAAVPLQVEATTARPPRQMQIATQVVRLPVGDSWMEMVQLPGGVLSMGSHDGDIDERPVHEVTLPPFRLGRLEVTQGQWQAVMGVSPSAVGDCADCPVGNVSWDDTQRFITRLNQQTGHSFRLPSEAEWEYACRAGGSEPYCGDADVAQVAWYADNSGGRVQLAGRLAPNGFGLHDMSGNLYEWVADCWHSSYTDAPQDGTAWLQGECQRRVLRGGAWYYSAAYARATYRNSNTPQSRFLIYGFRLAQDE